MVARVAGRVALGGDALLFADVEMIVGDLQGVLQLLRRFDDRRRQAGLDVPFDVAMEDVHACTAC